MTSGNILATRITRADVVTSLRALSLDQLAELYGAGDDDTMAAVLAETERRDQAEQARRARSARRAVSGETAEWYDAAFAQYLAAEAETRGYLLSRLGQAEGIEEPFILWRGPEAWAMAGRARSCARSGRRTRA
jgi:hypothetical protein